MAKKHTTKGKSSKKRQLKYGTQQAAVASAPLATATTVSAPKPRPAAARAMVPAVERDFSYVGHDIRRVGMIGGSALLLELILWYAFDHTGLGTAVYKLFGA